MSPADHSVEPTSSPAPRVPPTLGRGITVAVLYAVVFLAAALISGVDYDELSQSSSNVLTFVVIPVGLAILATLALTARWGWWDLLFHERPKLSDPRWLRAIPILWALVIVVTLATAPWDEWNAGLVLLVFAGTLMVGFGEEIVFRGYVLVGARGRYTEVGAWFVSTLAFALLHGLNIFTGQAVGATFQQIAAAFVFGSALYFTRRVTGLLVVGMLLHGLWDFSTFIGAGRGDKTGGLPDTIAALPFVWALGLTTIVALFVVFRRHRGGTAPAA